MCCRLVVCSEMAATPQEKSFCVLQLAKLESIVAVQRAFRRQFNKQPPRHKQIYEWHRKFVEDGCICKGKSTGRPRTSNENVERIRTLYERRPKKSTSRASKELNIPQPTVWRVLKHRLHMKPYKLQLLQALHPDDHNKRYEFCCSMLDDMEEDNFAERLIFSDESTFHLSGKVNRHNVRIWATENPTAVIEHERDSPKLNVFCAISVTKVYGPFFFMEKTVTGITYLDMLQNWLFPQIEDDSDDFIFVQDGAPPHFSQHVRRYLNNTIPGRWIGRGGAEDQLYRLWPPRSPDITPCDFYLWGYVKERVFIPPMPDTLEDLRHRIIDAVNSITRDQLIRVWQELGYRFDICRVTHGAHIECIP